MSDTFNVINFTRDEFATSLRVLLVGFSAWAEQFVDTGVISRSSSSADASRADLSRPFSAGVDVENAPFSWRMLQAYDFVTTGEWDTVSLEEFGHELEAFEQLCHLQLEDHIGMDLAPSIDSRRLPSPQEMCRLVFDHTKARWALLQGESLTLAQVAILAGLADKTIRMAANPKAPNRLVTFKDGQSTYVDALEAMRWLSGRSSFRLTAMRDESDTPRGFGSLQELARYCMKQRDNARITLPALMKELAWGKALQTAYRQLEDASPELDPRLLTVARLLELGQVLVIPETLEFARRAATLLASIAIELECKAAARARP